MSVLGTGTAAAVAGTALTAQQKARQQANARNGEQFAARRQADAYVQRLHAPADAEGAAGELPDRGAPGYERLFDGPGPDPNPAAGPGP